MLRDFQKLILIFPLHLKKVTKIAKTKCAIYFPYLTLSVFGHVIISFHEVPSNKMNVISKLVEFHLTSCNISPLLQLKSEKRIQNYNTYTEKRYLKIN